MTTWASYPVHMHPWFRSPSRKRKAPADADDALPAPSLSTRERSVSPRLKRRRCDLEDGIANLSLGRLPAAPYPAQTQPAYLHQYPYQAPPPYEVHAQPQSAPASAAQWGPSVQPYVPLTAAPVPVTLPGSVEEPTSPASAVRASDVRMHNSSWYEPEKDRIVVTDLDDSDTEETPASISGADRRGVEQYAVSPAVLARLGRRDAQRLPNAPDGVGTSDNMALVLFRPLPVTEIDTTATIEEVDDDNESRGDDDMSGVEATEVEEEGVPQTTYGDIEIEMDDAMDVEL